MTVAEASKALGVGLEAVRQMIHTGRLKAAPSTDEWPCGNWQWNIYADSVDEFQRTHVFTKGERGVRWAKAVDIGPGKQQDPCCEGGPDDRS